MDSDPRPRFDDPATPPARFAATTLAVVALALATTPAAAHPPDGGAPAAPRALDEPRVSTGRLTEEILFAPAVDRATDVREVQPPLQGRDPR